MGFCPRGFSPTTDEEDGFWPRGFWPGGSVLPSSYHGAAAVVRTCLNALPACSLHVVFTRCRHSTSKDNWSVNCLPQLFLLTATNFSVMQNLYTRHFAFCEVSLVRWLYACDLSITWNVCVVPSHYKRLALVVKWSVFHVIYHAISKIHITSSVDPTESHIRCFEHAVFSLQAVHRRLIIANGLMYTGQNLPIFCMPTRASMVDMESKPAGSMTPWRGGH